MRQFFQSWQKDEKQGKKLYLPSPLHLLLWLQQGVWGHSSPTSLTFYKSSDEFWPTVRPVYKCPIWLRKMRKSVALQKTLNPGLSTAAWVALPDLFICWVCDNDTERFSLITREDTMWCSAIVLHILSLIYQQKSKRLLDFAFCYEYLVIIYYDTSKP